RGRDEPGLLGEAGDLHDVVLNGPVRPRGTVTVEPLDGGSRSRVTIAFDLEGQGVGKLLAPLARRDARRRIAEDQTRLKERLEAGAERRRRRLATAPVY